MIDTSSINACDGMIDTSSIKAQRNAVAHARCRIKDFRAVATRYDKRARKLLAAAYIIAAITLWNR